MRLPLLHELLPTDIGFYPRAEGHYFERKTGLNQAIFIYCAKGKGWCVLRGLRHDISAGDLLVVPPGEPHSYGANEHEPWTISWFHVAGNDVRLLLGELGVSAERPVCFLGEDTQLSALCEEALGVMKHGLAPFQLLRASRLLGDVISLMIWRARQRWREEPDPRHRIAACISYMKQHMDKSFSLNMLAEMANLSPSHFNVLFHQETGFSCKDYLTRLRIQQACQWLETTNWPVKTLAARLGYEDPLYFSRRFKAVCGLSPKQYRQTHLGSTKTVLSLVGGDP